MTRLTPDERTFPADIDGALQRYLLLPPPQPEQAEILVVALHGHGSHQEQCMTPGIYGDAFGGVLRLAQARNLLYVSPEYRGNSWMNAEAEADVYQIIRGLRRQYSAVTRVLLIGGSMGGTSALIYAMRHADEVAGVVALCPATDLAELYQSLESRGGIPEEIVETLRARYGGAPATCPAEYAARASRRHAARLSMPITLVHGAADALIPVTQSRALVDAMTAAGHAPCYVEIAGGDHDAPVAYAAEALTRLLDATPVQSARSITAY